MQNAGVENKSTGETPSVFRALWDPFGFMQEMFGRGRGEGPLFSVEETDDSFVCKVKVQLTLPAQADVAHAKAELDNGELTLVVPKVSAAMPEAAPAPQTAAAAPEPEPPPPRRRGQEKKTGGGAPKRASRGGARPRARHG